MPKKENTSKVVPEIILSIGRSFNSTKKEFYKSNTCSGAHTFNPDHKPSDGFTKDFLEVKKEMESND